MNLDALLQKSQGKITIFKNLRTTATVELSEALLICIPDMHLLEKGPNDDFIDSQPDHEKRFLDFLYFLQDLRADLGDRLAVVQIGDLYDLWQARGNTNLIHEAYVNVLGNLEKLDPIYVIGNHDIDLYEWYKKQGQTFDRKWRWFYPTGGTPRILFEHGFQADFANNQANWSGAIGREIARMVGYMEYLDPDIDVILGGAWDSVSRMFSIYNAGLSPSRNPNTDQFYQHEYTRYYIERMQKYNRGDTEDHHGSTDLHVTVIGHTHSPRLVTKPADGDRTFYLLDCGSWVNGGHQFGVITGKELAVCQWG
jgi:UDP-2,3-diacylglucosamine pyrophosphatase LpxH